MSNNQQSSQQLDKDRLIQAFAKLLNKVFAETIISLDDTELTKIVHKVMSTELLSKLLDDLTPEQIEMFHTTLEGI